MSPAENEERLSEQLMILPTAIDRLQYLVDRSKNDPPLSEDERLHAQRVEGCQAEVWVAAIETEGRWHFRSESDAPVVKAVASLLCEIFSGATAEEIATHETTLLKFSGIAQNLTPTRSRGAGRILETIRRCGASA
jgi:cysteine desulfuration protein SufE